MYDDKNKVSVCVFLLKKDNPMIKLSNRIFLLFAGCYLNFLNIFTSL